jgi:CBS domain-containing protein
MSVGRICVREVDIAERTESVLIAAQRMFDRDVGTLVVIDHDRRPIGLVTDRDIALRATTTGRDPTTIRVAEIMTVDPQTVTEDTPIETALSLMRSNACRRLVVVDAAGRLVGILSLDDLLGLLAEEFTTIGALLDRVAPQRRS